MKVMLFTLWVLLSLNAPAQHQDRTLFIYNVAFGGFSAGIGAIINKPTSEKWPKAFLRGFWQGGTGGLLDYSAKKVLYLVNKDEQDLYAWPAKLLHAAGYSIIENASFHHPYLQNWDVDYGPVRFDFSFSLKKFKVRLLPEAFVATIIAANYSSFDAGTSLRVGDIIFRTHGTLYIPRTSPSDGITFGRATIYNDDGYDYTKGRIIAHELVHRLQYNEYQVFNSWLQPVADHIQSKWLQNLFSRYIYADIPYFLVPYYIDGIQRYSNPYKNFYEFEADRFATNKYVFRR